MKYIVYIFQDCNSLLEIGLLLNGESDYRLSNNPCNSAKNPPP
jgi:hypothetical protein